MRATAGVWPLAIAAGLLAGCAVSRNEFVEGVGPVGDRLLVQRHKVTMTSNPWVGNSVSMAQAEFFLCAADQTNKNKVRCEPATVELPVPK